MHFILFIYREVWYYEMDLCITMHGVKCEATSQNCWDSARMTYAQKAHGMCHVLCFLPFQTSHADPVARKVNLTMVGGKELFTLLPIIWLSQLAGARELQECGSCVAPIEFLPDVHKPVYTIGVLTYDGPDAAYGAYETTFTDYLSATAGLRFDPPISFEMTDLDFQTMYDLTASGEVDYLFVSPSGAACLEAQYGTQSLASILNKSTRDGVTSRNLPEFAGAIIAHANNTNINTLRDLMDKTVAATSISGFGSGLVQFYEMQKLGMSYINDPHALIFTNSQADIVLGVLNGTFDAGFVRADVVDDILEVLGIIEYESNLKVVDGRVDETDAGVYPYPHSTPMYPEWNIAALKQTPALISREVQAALLALRDHAKTGQALEACIATNGDSSIQCSDLKGLDPLARCDTTVETAKAASRALFDGDYDGWRTTKSYSEIRGLLQVTGFVQQDPVTSRFRCLPPSDLYDQIICPANFYKLPFDAYSESCPEAGVICPDSYECVCKPCYEAAAIEVSVQESYQRGEGCPKMSVCGIVEQNEVLTYTIADNAGAGVDLKVIVLEGNEEREVPVEAGSRIGTYSFSVSSSRVGSMILEIYDGNEQIEVSPLRVRVNFRSCPSGERATEQGNCECRGRTYQIGGKCVERWIVFVGK